MPKGVQLSHDNLLIAAIGAMGSTDVMTRDGRFLHCAPMFHLADLAAWSVAMLSGSTHVIVPMFTPVGVATAIAKHQVTDTLLVPTMIQMLVDSPDTGAVRHVLLAAPSSTAPRRSLRQSSTAPRRPCRTRPSRRHTA